MLQVTATEAKNQFVQICAQAKREPVFIEKGGQVDSVVVSIEQFDALRQDGQSLAQRQRASSAQSPEWLVEQDRDFEQNGLWCDALVAWHARG